MTERNVTLTIRSVQTLPGESPSPAVEQAMTGNLRQEGDSLILTYTEGGDSGLEGVRTTLRHVPGQVTLLREGAWRSQMVFQEGVRHSSQYETPYGALPLHISTRRVRSTLTGLGGELELEYDMELAGQSAGLTHFQLTVREIDPGVTCQ